MATLKSAGGIIALLLFVILFSCLFTVSEGQRALLLRLGKLTTEPGSEKVKVYKPGIHFKIPLITSAKHYDIRLRTMRVSKSRVLTEGQKYLLVDYYVKWRIGDLGRYYQRVGGYAPRAESLLEKRINNALRSAVGQTTLAELISGERVSVMESLKKEADSTATDIGIEVVDVRIKTADLPNEVARSVFERMRTKRVEYATKYRSIGKAESTAIRAQADANVQVSIANARNEAAQIRAQGRGLAAKTYADAFQKDAEFYAFHRSLEAYRHSFQSESDLLVLQPEGDFFKYFRQTKAKQSGAPVS